MYLWDGISILPFKLSSPWFGDAARTLFCRFRWENLAYRVRIRETKRNFFAWRQLIDAKNHAKQVMTAKYLLASFRRWEDYIEYRKARKQMMATVTSWHLKRLAGRVFHGWQAVVHRGGWRAESQVRIADAFRHLQLLSRAFGPWAALALRARDRYARIRNRLQLPESVSLQVSCTTPLHQHYELHCWCALPFPPFSPPLCQHASE